MPHLAQGDIQLGLEIRRRARLCPRRRSPPSVGGGKAVFPGIQPVGADPQLLGDHFRGLAAGQPVVNGFAFERFIEFTTGLDGCLCHGLVGSLSTQFSVRQFEAALVRAYEKDKEALRQSLTNDLNEHLKSGIKDLEKNTTQEFLVFDGKVAKIFENLQQQVRNLELSSSSSIFQAAHLEKTPRTDFQVFIGQIERGIGKVSPAVLNK